jgi:putative ABC transport system permease protein
VRVIVRELLRRPGRFVPVGGAMTALVVLLVILGGFLDGLERQQTGAFRAQGDRLWVLEGSADLQPARSRVDAATAQRVAAVDGVAAVGALSTAQTTARGEGAETAVDVVLVGYDLPTRAVPAPPVDGAVADARLRGEGVALGDVLAVGPTGVAIPIVAFAGDLTQGAPTLWLPTSVWRDVVAEAAPAATLPEGTAQTLVVQPAEGADVELLAARLAGVDGVEVADLDALLAGQPVVAQQSATFAGIIGVTFLVVLLVVALFFALLVLERVRLYAVLKAIGGRSGDLVAGVLVQALVVSASAFALGLGLALALVAVLPADLPVEVLPQRVGAILVGLLVTACAGVLLVLRRILRIDPAEAIG